MQKQKTMKKLYRYEIQYSNVDGDETNVILMEYPVVRETECFYFINPKPFYPQRLGQRKVSKKAENTYAYDDKEKAMKNFISRTEKRISWYKYWIDECEKAMEIVNRDYANS